MKLYTYQETRNELQKEYTRIVKQQLDNGSEIDYVSNHKINFDNGLMVDRKNNHSSESVSLLNRSYEIIKEVGFVSLGRNKLYATFEDFNKVITPIRKNRKKLKDRSFKEIRIVDVVPQSLIDKLSLISGFRKVTKDNLKIIRFNTRVIMNCGTNKVMEFETYNYSGTKLRASYMDKNTFEELYNKHNH